MDLKEFLAKKSYPNYDVSSAVGFIEHEMENSYLHNTKEVLDLMKDVWNIAIQDCMALVPDNINNIENLKIK